MNDDHTAQWLATLKTLTGSLALLDTSLLPESFGQDIVDPLSADADMPDKIAMTLAIFGLLGDLSALGQRGDDRIWQFWETAGQLFTDFAKADGVAFYRQSQSGDLNKIHPLASEEDAVDESWPVGVRDDVTAIDEPEYRQTWLLRLGANQRFPVVLKFFARLEVPHLKVERLHALTAFSGLWYGLLAPHFPKLGKSGKQQITIDTTTPVGSQPIIGKDPGLLRAVAAAEQAAASEATIYLMGESGTGKELFAKHVHRLSARAEGPFIPINCSAIPHELIESEMFGHEKGAFTGAYFRKIGKVEQADGGTLFLDEIGEMPLPFQAKLLRYLQEKQFTRVGGNQMVRSDARIVVATHRDLKEMVAQGAFREDLFYRINVIRIIIPPLRERGSDVRLLSEVFFRKYIEKSRASRRQVDETVFDVLARYRFPGNVRELDNIVQRTVVMTQKAEITAEDLPEEMFKVHEEDSPHIFQHHPFERFDRLVPSDRDTLRVLKKEVEQVALSYQRDLDRRFLLHLLEKAGGSARKAAEMADINRTLFYKLLKRAGLDIGLIKKEDS